MTYTVTLSPDSTQFTVNDNETVLTAALRQGLNLPHSCKSGSCGQCKAIVTSGSTRMGEHADHALSQEEQSQNKVLLCSCTLESDVQLDIPGFNGISAIPVKTLPVRVEQINITHDVARLRLALPKAPPFTFYAGQYVDLLLPGNHSRSYSLANAPTQACNECYLELHIRQRQDGVCSNMIFGETPTIKEKSILRVRGPLGSFVLQDNSKPAVMLATGTGYAPIRSILLNMIEEENDRPIHLYWGARHVEDLYALEEVQQLIGRLKNARFTAVLSQAADDWTGARGYVQNIAAQDYPDLSDSEVYACGSSEMIDSAQQLLSQKCQLPEQSFFADSFTPAI